MPELHLDHLSKVYPNGVHAVRDLSLTVQANEFFVLLGPSGSGKTTTLRLSAGLETPSAGRVWIGGKDVTFWPPHRRGVAMLFQTPALYPQRTVRQNLAFAQGWQYNVDAGIRQRLTSQEVDRRLNEAVQLLSLGPLLERRPAELSGGERQRAALGRALIRRPAVFLLDEPLAHVDAPRRRELGQELKALQRRLSATVLHVTHDQAEALALADRVALMDRGELQQQGAPAELYDRPANLFVASFLGSMSFIEGRLVADEREASLQIGDFRLELPGPYPRQAIGGLCRLGIRPEQVRIVSEGRKALPMSVASTELVGGQRNLNLTNGVLRLMALVERAAVLESGDRVMVAWDWTKACWFDGQSGRRLTVSSG